MNLEELAYYYNRCNPDEPLDPGDERRVDIDRTDVRGANWTQRLAVQFERSSRPVCRLFTGLRGSGKSTELRRLMTRLSDPQRAHLLPVLIDAEELLDITSEVDVSDVLTLVAYGAEQRVLEAEGKDPEGALQDGVFRRLWDWLRRTDANFNDAELGLELGPEGIKAGGKVGFELRTRPTIRHKLREAVSAHLSAFVREVQGELVLLNARARKLGYKGLVVIFDSLEKLRGSSLTWKSVLDSAERVFSNDAPYLQLPVHALYTVPAALVRRMNTEVLFLPMIKIRDRAGKPHAPGIEVARELLERRLTEDGLKALFGAPNVEARVREIIMWSGGYPRELVRLAQSLLEEEHFPLGEASTRRILNRAGNTYRGIVYDSGAIDWVGSIAETRKLITSTDAEREAADLFLQNNVVLRYLNEDEWFDVHPSVAEMPEVQRARRNSSENEASD
jgi:hypothetical protein